jgi:hypothetical protein
MIIASRTLRLKQTSGYVDVDVSLYAPVSESQSWSCKYEINWPSGLRSSAGHGIDAIQALVLTLQKIGSELYNSDAHAKKILWWDKPGNGFGFPMPVSANDLLQGDDKRFGA